ncbi:MAG: phage major capsid protein [Methanolobus sp.]|nr:phage major capsid protein [Methanolobus sp.]
MALAPSDVLNLLQKSIDKKIADNVPQVTPLLTLLKRNSGVEILANNTFYVTEWVGQFSNVGQFATGSQLTGGKADTAQITVSAKDLYADVQVHEKTVESMAKVSEGALIDFTKGYTDRMEVAIGREMNRTFNGNAAGKIARANGSSAGGTSITVQALDADTSDIDPTAYIEIGDYIKVGSAAVKKVTAKAGNVLTLSGSIAWADEAAIYKASADGAAATEMQGLKGLIVNTGTVQNVNVANYANLQAYVDSNSQSIASHGEAPMQKAYLKTVSHRTGKLLGIANLTVFNAWASKLTALKQTANTSEIIKGGFQLSGDVQMPFLDFMGGQIYMDIDAWTNHFFALDPSSMTIGDLGGGVKFSVAPDGKGVWARVTGYTPQYEATLRFYGELIMKRPKANAVCSALTA